MQKNDDRFTKILPHHAAVHERLINWSRWARPGRALAHVSPMFKYYRARLAKVDGTGGEAPLPESKGGIDILDAEVMERRIVRLRACQRIAIVWWYVFRNSPVKIKRRLKMSYDDIEQAIHDGRGALCSGNYDETK